MSATGIPRSTIAKWVHGQLPRHVDREGRPRPRCARCGHAPHDFAVLPASTYAYLLGLYLGDGTIIRFPRSYRLEVTLDRRYPGIIAECERAIGRVSGKGKAASRSRASSGAVVVSGYSRSWPCLLPQHGEGRKHRRRIELSRWQEAICHREPEHLLRGLVHSDGCRSVNRVRSTTGEMLAYPRYLFTNRSDDILAIFTDHLDLLGIAWTRLRPRGHADAISVARREGVAAMDGFVGPKS